MALECVLRIEDQFSNLKFVQSVRRDPQLGTQLYLLDCNGQGGQFCFSFLQALGDTDDDRITYFTFLKHKFSSWDCVGHTPGSAIDEGKKLLYILYGGAQLPISLKLFHLTYRAADKFGYRRIGIWEGPCVKVKNNIVCRPLPPPGINTLTVAPSGRLVTQCMIVQTDHSNPIGRRLAVVPADVIYKQGKNNKAVLKTLTNRFPFLTPLQSMMKMHPPVFSPSNHFLLWHAFDLLPPPSLDDGFDAAARKVKATADDDGRVILEAYKIPGHPVNGHINTIKIDPVAFVKSFLPKSIFDSFIASVPPPKHIYFGAHLELLGHVHKYVVFSFAVRYILAAKWPKEWYKLPELPPVGASKVMFIDKGNKLGEINDFHVISTDLYIKSQLGDAHSSVTRIELGNRFKDYRRCAFCDKQEASKMRNKRGKRVSKLKVCRKCKELNLHIVHSTCHYCSDECQRKHWKEHKIIHKRADKEKMIEFVDFDSCYTIRV